VDDGDQVVTWWSLVGLASGAVVARRFARKGISELREIESGYEVWRPMRACTRLIIAAAFMCLAAALGSHGAMVAGQMATADRVQGPAWWPTQGSAPRGDYVGAAGCASCHPRHAATQSTTAMARTATRAAGSEVLKPGRTLSFDRGGYRYEITSSNAGVIYSVSGGGAAQSAPLTWAFGDGKVGQSFLFERDSAFYEARVSYYDAIDALDFTPARAVDAPRTLDEAMARPVGQPEIRRCFGCHTTASTAGAVLDVSQATPGVTCEACHGPGRRHVEAIKLRRTDEAAAAVLNPAKLDPIDSVDFCGACHATFWDVKLADERGIAALRSQPYRLQSSRCWNGGDRRLACIACHNPHVPLVRAAAAYDARCGACHAAKGAGPTPARPVRGCRVAEAGCTSCHMPRYEVPGMHHAFTDHLIRVVRRGA
jgi:Cytochrome c554 and c-prime